MTVRLAALGLLIAILPVSIDVPALRDSSGRHETRFEGGLGKGQFSLISRGCQNQIVREVRNEVRSGGLAVEHEFPNDVVIGVRGGVVDEQPRVVTGAAPDEAPLPGRTNHYWNPHVAHETRELGIGIGYLRAERQFVDPDGSTFRPDVSAHLRVGDSRCYGMLRFMEDVPLGGDGYLCAEGGGALSHRAEGAFLATLYGPYDGTMIGVKGRFWLTPQAALHVRALVGGRTEYHTAVGITARLP